MSSSLSSFASSCKHTQAIICAKNSKRDPDLIIKLCRFQPTQKRRKTQPYIIDQNKTKQTFSRKSQQAKILLGKN